MDDLKAELMGFNLVLSAMADHLCEKRTAPRLVITMIAVLHATLVATMECSTLLIGVLEELIDRRDHG